MVHAVRRSGSSRQLNPRQRKPDNHMWRDCVVGRVVDDDWQNAVKHALKFHHATLSTWILRYHCTV